VGGLVAVVVIKVLYPRVTPAEAADIIVPHHQLDGTRAGTESDGVQPSTVPPQGSAAPRAQS